MGYYSQVVFAARGPKANIIAAVTTWRLTAKHPSEINSVLSKLMLDEEGGNYTISFETNCKWYADDPSVQMFEALFALLREDEEFIVTALVRVGENNDDVEQCFTGDESYDLVSYHRYAVLDVTAGKPLTEVLGLI